MKLAVEVFGKGMELEAGWGHFDLQAGRLLDVFYDPRDGGGRRWLDWRNEGRGTLEVWLGSRRISLTWGPAWGRWRRAQAVEAEAEALA